MEPHTLRLDLILDNQGLAGVVDLGGELGGDGVVSGLVLQDETLVALNALEDGRLLNRPLAHVRPILIALCVLALSVRWSPSRLPVVGELFKEWSLDLGWL